MEEIKRCRDCKYAGRLKTCNHPKQKYIFCNIEREDNFFWSISLRTCGKRAKRFKRDTKDVKGETE